MKKYDRLIFVSNSDTCRGPMAEAILKSKFLLSELEVESRGLVVLFPAPGSCKKISRYGRPGRAGGDDADLGSVYSEREGSLRKKQW